MNVLRDIQLSLVWKLDSESYIVRQTTHLRPTPECLHWANSPGCRLWSGDITIIDRLVNIESTHIVYEGVGAAVERALAPARLSALGVCEGLSGLVGVDEVLAPGLGRELAPRLSWTPALAHQD